jgi:hypothetical protein
MEEFAWGVKVLSEKMGLMKIFEMKDGFRIDPGDLASFFSSYCKPVFNP